MIFIYDDTCPCCGKCVVMKPLITLDEMNASVIHHGPYIDTLCIFCDCYCSIKLRRGVELTLFKKANKCIYACDSCVEYFDVFNEEKFIYKYLSYPYETKRINIY